MRFHGFTICAFAVLIAGCGNTRDRAESAPAPMMELSNQGAMAADGFAGSAKQSAPQQPAQANANPSAQSYLAYRYNYGFALPASAVAPTSKSHADICLKAGPSKCQVLSSNTSRGSSDFVSASLQLRAEPEWLKVFISDMESSIEEAKGETIHSGVSAEDLTRSILDTDARLKAQTTLRTRLEGLLATRDAKLPDLLALERELARVQGQIESATTTLNVLKKRVSMSVVDINYQTKQKAVSRSAFSPITNSLKQFVGNVAEGVGSVIEFISYVLPWLLFVILPGLWLLRWFWRRRTSKTS